MSVAAWLSGAFWLKDEGCAGEVKVEVQVSAVLARKGGSEVTVVGLSAVLAERSLNSNQAGRAVRAEALTVSEADLAELTAGRVEKVEKTGEKHGGSRSAKPGAVVRRAKPQRQRRPG